MQKGLDPTRTSTCMKCRNAPSRYYGTWGEEGLCRPCVLAMEPALRRKVLHQFLPAERKRWQLDELAAKASRKAPDSPTHPTSEHPTPAARPLSRSYTEAYRRTGAPDAPAAADRHERRRHSRVFAEVPVQFTVASATGPGASALHGHSFRTVSKDLSAGGVRLQIRTQALFDLPAGCTLRLELALPRSPERVRGSGVVRNVVRTSRGRDAGYLCVQFQSLSGDGEAALRRHLARGPSPA